MDAQICFRAERQPLVHQVDYASIGICQLLESPIAQILQALKVRSCVGTCSMVTQLNYAYIMALWSKWL